MAKNAIATLCPAVAVPIGVLLAGLEHTVANALHVYKTIQAHVTAGPDTLLGGLIALAAIKARGMAFRSIPWVVAISYHVDVGWGFRIRRQERQIRSLLLLTLPPLLIV
jgi:hypothetical protein